MVCLWLWRSRCWARRRLGEGGSGVWLVFGVKIDRGGEVTEVTGLEGAYG